METIDSKNINQNSIDEAMIELLELELKKSNPNITIDELKDIQKKENFIYTKFPFLK